MSAPKERIYGVDLGTSTSAVAWADRQGIQMVPAIGPSGGAVLTPSLVHLRPEGAFVGELAELAAEEDGALPHREFKREIGARRTAIGPNPARLSAPVLRKLAMDVDRFCAGQPLRRAVITHPQHFYLDQKAATAEAARLAGLELALTLSEPLAAAIDQGYGTRDLHGLVMVFDLGGGTLDVNVLEVAPGSLRVVGGSGDAQLGGRDVDALLLELLEEQARRELGASIYGGSPGELREAERLARRMKEELQLRRQARGLLSLQGQRLSVELGREALDQRMEPLLARMMERAERALSAAGVGAGELAEVALVGGSVRLRAVQRALRERHGERVRLADQVDLAVCRGAARVGHDLGAGAGALFWEEGPQQGLRARACGLAVQPPAQLQNQLPRHVGVVAEDQGRRLTVPMVEQGSPLPARHERCFYTTLPQAAEICVPIAEWEPEAPGAAVSLGELRIQGLPPGLPAGSPVLVSFSLDLGGGLRISARAAGREAEAELGLGRDPAAEPGPGLVDLPIWADSLP